MQKRTAINYVDQDTAEATELRLPRAHVHAAFAAEESTKDGRKEEVEGRLWDVAGSVACS